LGLLSVTNYSMYGKSVYAYFKVLLRHVLQSATDSNESRLE
jgi:hypothetical protein